MTQAVIDYASKLHKEGITKDVLQQVKGILEAVPEIRADFENPTVTIEKKHLVIERVFPKETRDFLKILCDNGDFNLFDEICGALAEQEATPEEKANRAKLIYVTPPTPEQLEGIRKFLVKESNNADIEIEMEEDPSLKSGFILRVGT